MLINKLIILLTALFLNCIPLTSMNDSTKGAGGLTPAKYMETSDGYGKRILFINDTTWVSANPGMLSIWNDSTLIKSIKMDGYYGSPIVWDSATNSILAGEYKYHLSNDSLTHLSSIYNQLSDKGYSKFFRIVDAAWDIDQNELIIYARYYPPKGLEKSVSEDWAKGRLLRFDGTSGYLKEVILETAMPMGIVQITLAKKFLVVADGSIKFWDRQQKKVIKEFESSDASVRAIGFNKQENLLSVVKANGKAELYDTQSWNVRSWNAHNDVATAVQFHPLTPLLITGGEDSKVKVWSVNKSQPELLITYLFNDPVEGINFNNSGDKLGISAKLDSEKMYLYNVKW